MVLFKLSSALVASFALTATAFESLSYPSSIAADSDFQVTANTGNDTGYSTYRVYLATTPSGYPGGPSCYLVNSTSISNTTTTLSIPANFAPNGNDYSIVTREFPSTGSADYTYGAHFELTGSSIASLTSYEKDLNGAALWVADDLPCTSYNCARGCANSSYPDDLSYGSPEYKTMVSCIEKCSGVTQDSTGSGSGNSTATTTAATGTSTGSDGIVGSVSRTGTTAAATNGAVATMAAVPGSILALGGLVTFLTI